MGTDWLPFPRSEIGGEVCVLQRRRRQCAGHPQNRIGAVVTARSQVDSAKHVICSRN